MPRSYQTEAQKKLIDNPRFGLFLDMGLGKTVSTLTAVSELLLRAEVTRVLIVAPKKVAESVWDAEAKKWAHLSWLIFSKILGSEKQRKEALVLRAHVYLINRENLDWLCKASGVNIPFDCVIIDELSSFKNHSSKRFKALAKVTAGTPRVYGLTGTPTPRGLENLWSQIFLLDRGERLGRTITQFRREWCIPTRQINGVFTQYEVVPHLRQKLLDKIKDITLCIQSEGAVDLPEVNYIAREVLLDPKTLKKYKEFEREKIAEFENVEVTALNAAALVGKLLQFSSGAIYVDEQKNYTEIHDAKLEALEELIEECEGRPVLVAYAFKSDRERILSRLKKYDPVALSGAEDIEAWNAGKIQVLLAHPASAGHGLNLQFGGSIVVWFGLTYDLELYEQFNKRLHRSGQKNKVTIYHLLGCGTKDAQVLGVLQKKATLQSVVLKTLAQKYIK